MTYMSYHDVEPIPMQSHAAVAMAPSPGFFADSMWELQLEQPASIRVVGDLEALLRSRGIGAAKLDDARGLAVSRGAVIWRGRYQDEILAWLDERHGPALTWAETDVQTTAGEVPALLAVSGDRIVACVAPLKPAAMAERIAGARLGLLEAPNA